MLIASLELGGTKTVAAIGTDPLAPLASVRLPTRDAEATLEDAEAFFRDAAAAHGAPAALGIATFGPIVLDPDAADWGVLGGTVKPGWSGASVGRRLGAALGCPVALDTDVGAAALAESRLGAGAGSDPFVYLTVGTGIGGGLIVGGEVVRGLRHPEMGHALVRRHPDDPFPGSCDYHRDCAEGLASGSSIIARFGTTLDAVPAEHPYREMLADYIGQLCAAVALVASPHRIVIGGGVMAGVTLEAVAAAMERTLAGYVPAPALAPPAFADAGLVGAFLLARRLV